MSDDFLKRCDEPCGTCALEELMGALIEQEMKTEPIVSIGDHPSAAVPGIGPWPSGQLDDFGFLPHYPQEGYDNVLDSGKREEFPSGAVRDSRAGKGRFDLLPPHAIARLAKHFENGAKKYGDRNWEKGQSLSRLLDSALRHLFQLLDHETSEDHAAAVAWNIMVFMETGHRIAEGRIAPEVDDLGWFKHPRKGPEDPAYEHPEADEATRLMFDDFEFDDTLGRQDVEWIFETPGHPIAGPSDARLEQLERELDEPSFFDRVQSLLRSYYSPASRPADAHDQDLEAPGGC